MRVEPFSEPALPALTLFPHPLNLSQHTFDAQHRIDRLCQHRHVQTDLPTAGEIVWTVRT
jgi:hypothetical protein